MTGLSKGEFKTAIVRLLDALTVDDQNLSNKKPPPKSKPPKERDLLKAFDAADEDASGVVSLPEFAKLFAMVKRGEVSGVGGRGLFGLFGK